MPPHGAPRHGRLPHGKPPGGAAPGERPAGRYRRAWAAERLRDNFWPVPALLLAAGLALAAVIASAARPGIPAGLRAGPVAGPGEVTSVLGIIASSTLTFLVVVFTLTLVAAAGQLPAVTGEQGMQGHNIEHTAAPPELPEQAG